MKGSAVTASILIKSSKINFSLLISSKIFLHKNLAFNLKNHFRKIFPQKKSGKKGMIIKYYQIILVIIFSYLQSHPQMDFE
jgi:hypothetical protein